MRRTTLFTVFTVATLLVAPLTAHARTDDTCGREARTIYANLVQPDGGQLTVQTQAGQIQVGTGLGDAGLGISTTGSFTAVIDYQCVMNMTLRVYKDGSSDPVHVRTFSDADLNGETPDTPCVESSVSEAVPIGLDGGHYTFTLSGTACNGKPLIESSGGHYVGDPPLPL